MRIQYLMSQYVHPFVLYVLFGTLVSYVLIKALFRLPRFRSSRTRVYMLFLPLLLPSIAFVGFHVIYDKPCFLGVYHGVPVVKIINELLCQVSSFVTGYITPLFMFTAVLAMLKGVVSIFACNKMVARYGYATDEQYPVLFDIVSGLTQKAGIGPVKVVITADRFAQSFTFGFTHPVIVLSQGILNNLDEEELEAVVAHELAHIIRTDSVLNWVSVFLRDMMFFTPIMMWLFRDLAKEREKATDTIGILLTGKPLALAGALVKVWRLTPKGFWQNITFDNFMPYPQFAANDGALQSRIKRLMDWENTKGEETDVTYAVVPAFLIVTLSLIMLYYVC